MPWRRSIDASSGLGGLSGLDELLKGMTEVSAVLRCVFVKSMKPGDVKVRMRFRVRSMPHGCVWIGGERTLRTMFWRITARPGRII